MVRTGPGFLREVVGTPSLETFKARLGPWSAWLGGGNPAHGRGLELHDLQSPLQPKPFYSLSFLFCLVLCTALGQNHHNNDVRTKQEVGEKSTYPYEMQ